MLPVEVALEMPALSEERGFRHKFSYQIYLPHQMKILCPKEMRRYGCGFFSPICLFMCCE